MNSEIQLNFVCGGLMGDFIHSLYAVRGICDKFKAKANLYIIDSSYGIGPSENFKFNLDITYNDLQKLMSIQEYVNYFSILPKNNIKDVISIDSWRNAKQYKNWSILLSEHYSFEIKTPYSWININTADLNTKNAILLHRSLLRRSHTINWKYILSSKNKFLFLTTKNNMAEYNQFINEFDCSYVEPYNVDNLFDMASAIKGCKKFIGNQSMPMALACSLDVPRICELNPGQDALFYFDEKNFSNNIKFKIDLEDIL
jgi:hypothetical protein